MKNFFLVLTFLMAVGCLSAQTSAPIAAQVDQVAYFKGGDAAVQAFVDENQRKLDIRRTDVDTDVVVMEFVVELDGRATNFRKISAPNVMMEEEAVVLILKMRFVPAKKGNQMVRSVIQLPIKLNLL